MEDTLSRGRRILASRPFSVLLGADLLESSPGVAALKIPVRTELMRQQGFVHAGALGSAADNALTYAGGSESLCATAQGAIARLGRQQDE